MLEHSTSSPRQGRSGQPQRHARLPAVGDISQAPGSTRPRRRANDLGRASRRDQIADRRWRLDPAPGVPVFNLYRAPIITPVAGTPIAGCTSRKSLGADAGDIIRWLAHRVQKPADKINHAWCSAANRASEGHPARARQYDRWWISSRYRRNRCSGVQGSSGRDPARIRGARPRRVRPLRLLRPHEVRWTAAPPDVLRIDESTAPSTTFPTSPASSSPPPQATASTAGRSPWVSPPSSDLDRPPGGYWNAPPWYDNRPCCDRVVAHYLLNLDLAAFDPKAPPPQTNAFFDRHASRSPEMPSSPMPRRHCTGGLTPGPRPHRGHRAASSHPPSPTTHGRKSAVPTDSRCGYTSAPERVGVGSEVISPVHRIGSGPDRHPRDTSVWLGRADGVGGRGLGASSRSASAWVSIEGGGVGGGFWVAERRHSEEVG